MSDSEKNRNVEGRLKEILKLCRKAEKLLEDGRYEKSAAVYGKISTLVSSLVKKKRGRYHPGNTLNDLTGREWIIHTKSWFIIDGKPSDFDKFIRDHPGSYPPELAAYFIEFFTKKNGWVLDPFMGIGSTAVASLNLGRNCIGIELNEKYYRFARERIKNKLTDDSDIKILLYLEDARNITEILDRSGISRIDFVLTSPPYWNILSTSRGGVVSAHKKRIMEGYDKTYGDDPRDLANISSYPEFLDTLSNIFLQIRPYIKEGGYLCVILQNFRPPMSEVMVPMAWDVAYRLSKIYKLQQEYIWCQDKKRLGIWGYPKTYVSNVHHHYCLIFKK